MKWASQTAIIAVLFIALLASPASNAQTSAAPATPGPTGTHDLQATAKVEPTFLAVADEYVKVVGGVVAVLGTVLGFPVVYQTFRKTRAEITKIDLEAAKLRKELGSAAGTPKVGDTETLPQIYIDGDANKVSILTDPRWAAPLLVLVDAFIASIFLAVVGFAIDMIPLPYIFTRPLHLIAYLAIFYPVFRAARRVKKSLGADLQQPVDPAP